LAGVARPAEIRLDVNNVFSIHILEHHPLS